MSPEPPRPAASKRSFGLAALRTLEAGSTGAPGSPGSFFLPDEDCRPSRSGPLHPQRSAGRDDRGTVRPDLERSASDLGPGRRIRGIRIRAAIADLSRCRVAPVGRWEGNSSGIELKGWYLLAREGVPTYRFTATAAACNAWDLLVVVPWVLEDILSGAPILYAPFVESARYCAETRNHYWMYQRSAAADTSVRVPEDIRPYPAKSDPISDSRRRTTEVTSDGWPATGSWTHTSSE